MKKNGYITLNEYLDYIQYFKDTGETDKVQIMIMHASKRLEYKNVFVVNLHEKYPYLNKDNYEKLDKNDLAGIRVIEEERRLLYVSMTRAKERLFVLGSVNNMFIKELKEIQENV